MQIYLYMISLLVLINTSNCTQCTTIWWNEISQMEEIMTIMCQSRDLCTTISCDNDTLSCISEPMICSNVYKSIDDQIGYPMHCENGNCILFEEEVGTDISECNVITYNNQSSIWLLQPKGDGTPCNDSDICSRYSCTNGTCGLSCTGTQCKIDLEMHDIVFVYTGVITLGISLLSFGYLLFFY